jgi:bacterioferritin (cytochrome b1)
MQDFIENHNIQKFIDQLKDESDPVKRAMLIKLLAEEEAKHALTLANTRPLASD